ncbi:CFEM-domain-containing protein [Stemphylium lycopersici]|uniref:CFEM-domain-containing protein n=1 Tax=Stemphylium lycopersici TaxID=183478 RepID=A0A364N065_STELY|nr:proline-rich antigen [Stemphylium lycopersici]RAR07723.1 CFEM-domain-containing protein [Stemphylium lycopersici]RAR08503.1 CFEM-domain-containing protein [Stemphylium lycopersici]
MKSFTIASIVALATVASAQLDNIPECALACFVGPLTSDGCESLTDFACHCKKGDTLLASVQPCVEGACSADDQAAAISAVESTCKAAGVPITIPDSSAAPEVSSAVETVVTSVISSPVETVSSVVSSAAEYTSAMMSSAMEISSTMEIPSSITPVPLPTVNGTGAVSLTPSSSMPEFTGAAAQATHAAGIIGAAALAMLAL